MAKTDVQHDVIVIGAGIAGLVAANRAAQLGKRVVVLEKSKEEKYLCNSRYTYGTFHVNFTDVGADEDVLFDKIEACSEGLARKDLARAIAKDGRRLMQWLRSEGIDLVDLGGYQTNVLAPPWREGFGLTWRGYAGDVALARLEENLRQRQGRILRGMRARTLERVPFTLTRKGAETRSSFFCVVAFSAENRKSTFPENALTLASRIGGAEAIRGPGPGLRRLD